MYLLVGIKRFTFFLKYFLEFGEVFCGWKKFNSLLEHIRNSG